MRSINRVLSIFLFAYAATNSFAQSVSSFPPPDAILVDTKHKEPKSGVQVGPGNTITIQQGVGTPTTINVLTFSKDGKLLAAGKDFGRVVVWDVPNRKFLCAVNTGQGIVHAVALSPDGQLMATGGEGDRQDLKLWHLPDGKLVRTYNCFHGYVLTAAFGPSSTWLVVSENIGSTHVLDVRTGQQILEMKEMNEPLLSPDGTMLMTASETDLAIWSTSDWKQQRALPRSPRYAVPLALDPQNDRFVIVRSDFFRLVRLSTGESFPNSPMTTLPKFNAAAGGFAAFATDTPIVFGHSDGRLWAWDSSTGRTCVSDVMYSESGSLSPDGTVLAGAKDSSILAPARSGDGVWLWDVNRLAAKCGLAHLNSDDPLSPREE
jgi:WD40 repeat protein